MISRLMQRLSSKSKNTWFERHFLIVLIVAGLIFSLISLLIGLNQSVWFDEAYSIMIATRPVDELVHLVALDTHPPLYYLVLKAWAGLFGWSEFALRSLSVLAAGGAVIFGGLLVKRMFGVRIALMALPFVVFAPFLLRYGFEIRMYALASLVGIAATYTLILALEARNTRKQRLLYLVYAVLVAIGMYTLYYMALLWIAHFTWLLWLAIRDKKSIMKMRWLVAYSASVVLFLPWLPTFLSQVNNGALAAISQPLTIDNMIGIISFNFVYQPVWQLSALLSLVIVIVIGILIYFVIQAYKVVAKRSRHYLTLLALYVLVPVAVLALVSLSRPMYVERYLAHILIGGCLFVGVCIALSLQYKKASVKSWIAAAVCVAVLFIGVIQLTQVGNYNFQRVQVPTVDQAASAIGDCTNGTPVLAADPYVAIELSYYLPKCQIHFHADTLSLGGGYAPLSDSEMHVDNPEQKFSGSHELYYIYYDEPKLQMPAHLTVTSQHSYGPMTVVKLSAE